MLAALDRLIQFLVCAGILAAPVGQLVAVVGNVLATMKYGRCVSSSGAMGLGHLPVGVLVPLGGMCAIDSFAGRAESEYSGYMCNTDNVHKLPRVRPDLNRLHVGP